MNTTRTPYFSYSFVGACIATYLFLSLSKALIDRYSFIPLVYTESAWKASYRLVTAMFLHVGLYHLVTNLMVFILVAPILERLFGWYLFALAYITIGSLGFIGSWLEDSASITPIVGSSGAISFLLGAHLMLFPRRHLRLLRIPFWVIAVPWFLLQLTGYFSDVATSSVAYPTHIVGFVLGLFGASVWRVCGEDTEFRIQHVLMK